MRRIVRGKLAPEPVDQIEEPAYHDYDERKDFPLLGRTPVREPRRGADRSASSVNELRRWWIPGGVCAAGVWGDLVIVRAAGAPF
jgi:hypothetical protein